MKEYVAMTMNRNEHLGQTALLAGLLLIYTPARAAAPTTWHVHNNGDIGAIGSGDLREAVTRAGAGDTIVFDGVVRGTGPIGPVQRGAQGDTPREHAPGHSPE